MTKLNTADKEAIVVLGYHPLQEQFCEKLCKHHVHQKDMNGDIAITFCTHPENPSDTEGNTTTKCCPIIRGD